jgi:hypothetical protein
MSVRKAETVLPVARGDAEASWVARARVDTVRGLLVPKYPSIDLDGARQLQEKAFRGGASWKGCGLPRCS